MLIGPQNLAVHVNHVRSRILIAARDAGRDPNSVELIAVSKTQGAESCRAMAMAGVTEFGENYLQEAQDKITALADLKLNWHFIGKLQSNKTRIVAQHFAWVHTVDRLTVARRLSEQRPFHAPPLNLCIQVLLVPEATKAGVEPEAVANLAASITELPRVRLRGLMCLPPPAPEATTQRAVFSRLRRLLESLNLQGFKLDALSMGMSQDFEAAIAEGATHIRLGTALFGARHKETHE